MKNAGKSVLDATWKGGEHTVMASSGFGALHSVYFIQEDYVIRRKMRPDLVVARLERCLIRSAVLLTG